MKNKYIQTFAILNFFFVTTLNAQYLEWVKTTNNVNNRVESNSIAVDENNNIYCTGSFTGICDFDPGLDSFNLSSNDVYSYFSSDIFITKSDSSGNLIWAKRIGGPSTEQGEAITVDYQGNLLITGYMSGTVDFGGYNLTSEGGGNPFVLKLDSNGNTIWAKLFKGYITSVPWCTPCSSGGALGHTITTDQSGNIYTSGDFGGEIDLDPGSGVFKKSYFNSIDSTAGGTYIVKLNSSGDFIWGNTIGVSYCNSISVDANNNLLCSGYFRSKTDFDPGNDIVEKTPFGGKDIFILKLDVNGEFAWVKTAGGSADDRGIAVITNDNGEVYMSGKVNVWGTDFNADIDPGPAVNLISQQNSNILLKLDAEGNTLWAQASNNGSNGETINIDLNNNVISVGRQIKKYNSNGGLIWASLPFDYGTLIAYDAIRGIPFSQSITIDSSNKLLVTGSFIGTRDFDLGPGIINVSSEGSYNAFVLKIDQTPCSGYPAAGVVSVNSPRGCAGSTMTLNATGLEQQSIDAYQWQSSLDSLSGWTDIAGANVSVYSTSIYSSTISKKYYRLVSICSNTGLSSVSNIVSYTVYPIFYSSIISSGTTTLCEGDSVTLTVNSGASFLWNTGETSQSIVVDNAGDYSVVVTNEYNCSYTAYQSVSINRSFRSVVTACTPYYWNGVVYEESGFYTFNKDCGLIDTLLLTYQNETIYVEINDSICQYGGYYFNYQWITEPGTYVGNFTTYTGCDSTVTLNLNIIPAPEYPLIECYQTANFNYQTCSWEVSGALPEQPFLECYQTASFNIASCSWEIISNPADTIVDNIAQCDSYFWNVNGETYSVSGNYFYNNDCQDYALNLIIYESSESTIEVNTCGPYAWNGGVYSKSGVYNYVNGCASQTLLLHLNEVTEVNAQIFSSETYLFNGTVYSETGVYYDTIPRVANCDSIVRLNLYVNPTTCEIIASDDSLCSVEIVNLSVGNDLMVYTLRPNNIESSYGNYYYQGQYSEFRGQINSSNPYYFELSTGILIDSKSMPDFNNFILISDPTNTYTYYDDLSLEFITYIKNIDSLNIDSTYYYRAFIISGNDTILAPNQHTFFVRNETFNPMLDYGDLIDIDENRYKTINIGSQTWMAENLMTNHYANGDSLENEMSLYFPGGGNGQYNHPEIYDQRNICPVGTHVPNDSDWFKLFNYTFNNEPYVYECYYNPLSDSAYYFGLQNYTGFPQGAGPLQSNNKESWNWGYRTNSSGFSSATEDLYNNNHYWSSSIIDSVTLGYLNPNELPDIFPLFNQVLFSPGGVQLGCSYNYYYGEPFNEIRCISNEEITEDKFPTIEGTQSLSVSSNTASFHVDIENGNNAELTEKGMIISTFTSINGLTIGILPDKDDTPFPLVDDYKILQFGSNPSDFNVDINNLMPSGKYYVRAYVKNKYGIRYGEELTIRTKGNYSIFWSTGETSQSINVYPTQTTTYSVTIDQGGRSCTSDKIIAVNQPTELNETASACGSYTWRDNTYTQSGTYTWTGTNAGGCISTATLNLTIFERTTSTIEVNTCGPYEWNGVVYSKSGAYTSLNSCASQTLLLHINEITEVNTQINSGETYNFNGIAYSETGVYYDTIPRGANCDSIVRLNLYVNPTTCEIIASDDSLCSGEVINLSVVNDLMVYTLRPNNIESSYFGNYYQSQYSEFRGRVNSSNPYYIELSTGILIGSNSMPNFNNFILISDPTSSFSYNDGSGLEFITYFYNINTLNIDSTYYYRAFIISGNDTILAPNQHTFFVRNETFNPMLDYGELIDIDENRYKTITIGSQTWMAENLMTNHYSNGESLENDMSLYFPGGGNGQYNHTEIYDQRNICPLGTHVPNDSDWVKLFNYTFNNEPYVFECYYNPLSDSAYYFGLQNYSGFPQGAGPLQSNNKESWNWGYRTNSSGFSSTTEDPYNNNHYWSSSIIDSVEFGYLNPNEPPDTFPLFNQILFSSGGVQLGCSYNYYWPTFNEIRCISNEEITEDKFPIIEGTQSISVSSNAASFHVDIENGNSAELSEKGMIISTFTSVNGLTIGILPDKDDTPFPLVDDYKILQFGSNPIDFNVDIDNLMPSGKYYVRAFVKNKYGIRYGEELTITTQGNSILWSTGEAYQSINVYPTETTTYSVTINQGEKSCTSDKIITVNQPTALNETVSACGSYTWRDSTYTQSGTYTWTGINAGGCDSVMTLNLTITPQPEQPQLYCWQTASYNTSTCLWDISGTQTEQPQVACYQTATFNGETCSWEITGEMPQQPQTACYQMASFNAETCSWSLSGTMPEEPVIACYETANFNSQSCTWEVRGTPAAAIVTNATTCDSYTWAVNNQQYTTSGLYSFNSNCQDYILNLTIPTNTTSTTTASACGSYTWAANGQTYTQSGTYSFLDGCESRVLQLTISAATNAEQIFGPVNSCPHQGTIGTNATYSVQATNATSYVWIIPSGATNVSGQGTSSISFKFASSFTSGTVRVTVSGCGDSVERSLAVTRIIPATPAVISGPVNVCGVRGGSTPVTYSIDPVANATSYTWTLPGGITLSSGGNTVSVQVLIASSFTSGSISVRANANCGSSSNRSLAINTTLPSRPASISGATRVCPGDVITYTASVASNSDSYLWSVPTGASITSGSGTNVISLSFDDSFTGGTLSVNAVNGCGQGSLRSITLSRNLPARSGLITGTTNDLCTGGPFTYSIAAVAGAASYSWSVPTGATIVSNIGTSISVNYAPSFSSGSIRVAAINACGTGLSRSLIVSRLPATPATISGTTPVCINQSGVVFSTPAVSGMTFTWTVPSGAVISSGQGTASIVVNFGTTGGNVTVRAVSSCGTSSARTRSVSVTSCRLDESGQEEVVTEAMDALEFVLYPNPGIGTATIGLPQLEEKVQLRVFAANGTLIRQEQIPAGTRSWTIQLEAEADGVYMIDIQTLTQVKQFRYIKQ